MEKELKNYGNQKRKDKNIQIGIIAFGDHINFYNFLIGAWFPTFVVGNESQALWEILFFFLVIIQSIDIYN